MAKFHKGFLQQLKSCYPDPQVTTPNLYFIFGRGFSRFTPSGFFPDSIQCLSCVIGRNEVIIRLLWYVATESPYYFLNTGHSFFQFLTWVVLAGCAVVQAPFNHTRTNRAVLVGEIVASCVIRQTTVALDLHRVQDTLTNQRAPWSISTVQNPLKIFMPLWQKKSLSWFLENSAFQQML